MAKFSSFVGVNRAPGEPGSQFKARVARHLGVDADTVCACCGEADDPNGSGPAVNTGFCADCNKAGCPNEDISAACLI